MTQKLLKSIITSFPAKNDFPVYFDLKKSFVGIFNLSILTSPNMSSNTKFISFLVKKFYQNKKKPIHQSFYPIIFS